jgi:hypothetical protein
MFIGYTWEYEIRHGDYEYTYNFCAKYFQQVSNYKMFRRSETLKLCMTNKFDIDKINADL